MKLKFILPLLFLLNIFTINAAEIITNDGEHYEIVSLLGQGERAMVFLVKCSCGCDHYKAIKRYYTKDEYLKGVCGPEAKGLIEFIFADDVNFFAKYEYWMGQKLEASPSVVRMYDLFLGHDTYFEEEDCEPVDQESPRTYLVMEYVDGSTLSYYEYYTLSICKEKALQNTLSFIETLKYAYCQNLFHSDCYSSNLMIDRQETLRFIDLESFEEISEYAEMTYREYLNQIVDLSGRLMALGGYACPYYCLTVENLLNIDCEEWLDESINSRHDVELFQSLNALMCYFKNL